MTIKVTKLGELDTKASFLFYGEAGIGKTSLAKTLPVENDERLLYLGVDPGQLSLRGRSFSRIWPDNGKWTRDYLVELAKYIRDYSNKFDWVVIDGIDDLGNAILSAEKKNSTNLQRAYGEMGDFMIDWMLAMRDIDGTNPIFITHIESNREPDGTVTYRPAFPGRMVTERLINYFDFCGCMRLVGTEDGQRRMIQFKREANPRYEVKERGDAVAPLEEPNLSAIMDKLKAAHIRVTSDVALRNREELKVLGDLLKKKNITLEQVIAKFGSHPKTFSDTTYKLCFEWAKGVEQ